MGIGLIALIISIRRLSWTSPLPLIDFLQQSRSLSRTRRISMRNDLTRRYYEFIKTKQVSFNCISNLEFDLLSQQDRQLCKCKHFRANRRARSLFTNWRKSEGDRYLFIFLFSLWFLLPTDCLVVRPIIHLTLSRAIIHLFATGAFLNGIDTALTAYISIGRFLVGIRFDFLQ